MWQAVNIGRRKFKKPISTPGMEKEYNFYFFFVGATSPGYEPIKTCCLLNSALCSQRYFTQRITDRLETT